MILEYNFTARLQTIVFKLHHRQSDFRYWVILLPLLPTGNRNNSKPKLAK